MFLRPRRSSLRSNLKPCFHQVMVGGASYHGDLPKLELIWFCETENVNSSQLDRPSVGQRLLSVTVSSPGRRSPLTGGHLWSACLLYIRTWKGSQTRPVEDKFGHVKCHSKQTLTDRVWWSWQIIMVKVYIVLNVFKNVQSSIKEDRMLPPTPGGVRLASVSVILRFCGLENVGRSPAECVTPVYMMLC